MTAEFLQQPGFVGLAAGDVVVVLDVELLDQGPQEAVGLGDFDQALQRGCVLADARQHVLIRGHPLLARIDHDQRGRGEPHRNQEQNDDANGENAQRDGQDAPAVIAEERDHGRNR